MAQLVKCFRRVLLGEMCFHNSVWVELFVFAAGAVGGFPHPLARASAPVAERRTAFSSTLLRQGRRRWGRSTDHRHAALSHILTAPGLGGSSFSPFQIMTSFRPSSSSSSSGGRGAGEMTFPPHRGLSCWRDKQVSSRRRFRSSAERLRRARHAVHRPPLSGWGFIPVKLPM